MSAPDFDRTQLPARIARLAHLDSGMPIPAFVEWIDGRPDFRMMSSNHWRRCVQHQLCWICGDKLGVYKSFVIGPMCAINRVISEPPSHLDCAMYAARACPFLSDPNHARRDEGLPENRVEVGGIIIARNPGVVCVWVTKSFRVIEPARGNPGHLFSLDEPVRTLWYCRGRAATREEVEQSIATGLPLLEEMAKGDGYAAERDLAHAVQKARQYLPGG